MHFKFHWNGTNKFFIHLSYEMKCSFTVKFKSVIILFLEGKKKHAEINVWKFYCEKKNSRYSVCSFDSEMVTLKMKTYLLGDNFLQWY